MQNQPLLVHRAPISSNGPIGNSYNQNVNSQVHPSASPKAPMGVNSGIQTNLPIQNSGIRTNSPQRPPIQSGVRTNLPPKQPIQSGIDTNIAEQKSQSGNGENLNQNIQQNVENLPQNNINSG